MLCIRQVGRYGIGDARTIGPDSNGGIGAIYNFDTLIPVMQFLCLSNIIKYFTFYMLGMLASKMNFGKYTKYKAKTLVLIIILLLFFLRCNKYISRKLR